MQEHKTFDYDYAEDEEEETLSLSNLVTHDVAAWDDYPSSRVLSSLEQDRFEFFTGDYSAKITTLPHHHHQNIIFCGKLIQSKNPAFTNRKEFNYPGLSKNCNNDISVHGKMVALTSSSRKSRWYMLFLGTAPSIETSGGAQLRESKRRPSHRQVEGGQRLDEYRKKNKGGLWGLVKALGCGEISHATAVSESTKSIPRVSHSHVLIV